jgi:hypothetical protein
MIIVNQSHKTWKSLANLQLKNRKITSIKAQQTLKRNNKKAY